MSTKDGFEKIRSDIEKIVKERNETNDLLLKAVEAVKMLKRAVPNVLCDIGTALCKLAETVLPTENLVVIKMNSSTRQCTVHILCNDEKGMSLEDFEYFLANAHEVGKHMKNEDGRLVSRHDKAIN